MRARSLVRLTMNMQKQVSYGVIVRPFIAIDYGAIVSHGVVMARAGFDSVIPANMRLPKSSNTRKSRIHSHMSLVEHGE